MAPHPNKLPRRCQRASGTQEVCRPEVRWSGKPGVRLLNTLRRSDRRRSSCDGALGVSYGVGGAEAWACMCVRLLLVVQCNAWWSCALRWGKVLRWRRVVRGELSVPLPTPTFSRGRPPACPRRPPAESSSVIHTPPDVISLSRRPPAARIHSAAPARAGSPRLLPCSPRVPARWVLPTDDDDDDDDDDDVECARACVRATNELSTTTTTALFVLVRSRRRLEAPMPCRDPAACRYPHPTQHSTAQPSATQRNAVQPSAKRCGVGWVGARSLLCCFLRLQ